MTQVRQLRECGLLHTARCTIIFRMQYLTADKKRYCAVTWNELMKQLSSVFYQSRIDNYAE